MISALILEFVQAIPFPSWIDENAISIGNFNLKWYGISYIIGITLAYFWARRTCNRPEFWKPAGNTRGAEVIPDNKVLEDLFFFCLLGIMVGGRIGSVILYTPEMIWESPLDIFKIWQGGMSFHGGFLGVIAAMYYVARKSNISFLRIADVVAIGAPFGPLMVRILGNFFNQELWGRPTNVPWAVIFEKDLNSLPRHPSQLYEAGLEGMAIFLILWLAFSKFKALTKPGICGALFTLLYGVFRIFIEFFREPDAALFGPLTRGMTYSLPMVIIGGLILIWAIRRQPVEPQRMATLEPAET